MATTTVISKELLYVEGIKAFDAKSPDAQVDPTTLPVQIAAVPADGPEPVEDDWHDAEWADTTTARILVGPGAFELTVGRYAVWLRVTGAVERPQRPVGDLYVV